MGIQRHLPDAQSTHRTLCSVADPPPRPAQPYKTAERNRPHRGRDGKSLRIHLMPNLPRRLVCEVLGTALLLAAVVGSGIMAQRLSGGNNALALLANAIATGAALYPLILSFDRLSGAHFNPAVSLVMAINGELRWRPVGPYMAVQTIGAIAGVWLAHLMFDLPILQTSPNLRTG